jgi:hypothetical protein
MPMHLLHSKDTVHTMSMECMHCIVFDKMPIGEHLHFKSSSAVLNVLRNLKGMAGQALLQIMHWFGCSVVY